MTRGIKREGLCRGRKFTTHITTSYHSRAPRARAKMSQPKAALPDARVRQEAQQTLSAWAEKNHRGRAWRTGCRRRWFVMHGFHICYYADEKTAGQAAAILTVAAYYGYTNYGEPTVGRRPRVAANPSPRPSPSPNPCSAARSTYATCASSTTRSTPPLPLAPSTSSSPRRKAAARRKLSRWRSLRRRRSVGFVACAPPHRTTRCRRRCERSAARSWRRRWTTALRHRGLRARPMAPRARRARRVARAAPTLRLQRRRPLPPG